MAAAAKAADQLAEPFAELLAEASEGGIILRIGPGQGAEKVATLAGTTNRRSAPHVAFNATVHVASAAACPHHPLGRKPPSRLNKERLGKRGPFLSCFWGQQKRLACLAPSMHFPLHSPLVHSAVTFQ